MSPPIVTFLATPRPPLTINAPESVDAESVVLPTVVIPDNNVVPVTLKLPLTPNELAFTVLSTEVPVTLRFPRTPNVEFAVVAPLKIAVLKR